MPEIERACALDYSAVLRPLIFGGNALPRFFLNAPTSVRYTGIREVTYFHYYVFPHRYSSLGVGEKITDDAKINEETPVVIMREMDLEKAA